MLQLSLPEPGDAHGKGQAHRVKAVLLTDVALERRRGQQEGHGLAHLVAALRAHHNLALADAGGQPRAPAALAA
eukprot:14214686-Heterocapsa_arctica.AAC.1